MDEINVFSKVLTLAEIMEVQRSAAQGGGPLPGQPELTVSREGAELVLSWESSANFQVQATGSLTNPQWAPVTVTPDRNGNVSTVRLPVSVGARFFRLAEN